MSEQVLGVSAPNESTGSVGDHVAQLVGEGKKFKTVDDLAKGKIESDNFVKQLQEENKALRDIALAKAEENNSTLLSELAASLANRGNTNSTPTTTQANQSAKPGLTEEDVNALIEKRDAMKNATTNVGFFNKVVASLFADKAADEVKARLDKAGIDPQTFVTVVAKSPQAALSMLGFEQPKGGGPIGSRDGSVNTEALPNRTSSVKDAAYFRDLRRKLGARYYTPEIQQDLFKSRKELGDKFYGESR